MSKNINIIPGQIYYIPWGTGKITVLRVGSVEDDPEDHETKNLTVRYWGTNGWGLEHKISTSVPEQFLETRELAAMVLLENLETSLKELPTLDQLQESEKRFL